MTEATTTCEAENESTPQFSPQDRIEQIQEINRAKVRSIQEEAAAQTKACKARLKEVADDELGDIRDTAKAQTDTANTNAKRAVRNWRDVLKAQKNLERKAKAEEARLEKAEAKKKAKAEAASKESEPVSEVEATPPSNETAQPPTVDVPDNVPGNEAAVEAVS